MIAFIDDHRQAYGVEPICKVLPIAPSTYHAHAARRADPGKLPTRTRNDVVLMAEIRRVFEANFHVYGVRKMWRQLDREGYQGCPLHGGAPDAEHGAARSCAGQKGPHHCARPGGSLPAGPRQPPFQGTAPERPVGQRHHLDTVGEIRWRV